MKKTLLTAVLLFAAILCATAQNNSYLIVGHAPGHDGATVTMSNTEGYAKIDSTVIANGRFQFSGSTDTAMLVNLYCTDGSLRMDLLLLPGSDFKIDVPSLRVVGNRPTEQLVRFDSDMKKLRDEQRKVAYQLISEEEGPLKDSLNALYFDYNQRKFDYFDTLGWHLYEANADNKVGAMILYDMAYMVAHATNLYDGEVPPMMQRIRKAYAAATPVVKRYHPLSDLMQSVESQLQIRPGVPFRDFEAVAYPSGEKVTLGSYIKGHVAVVDFWASWCGPCRKEIVETLKPLHKKYADSGLVVVGVDVWDKPTDHDEAVKELEITYPQIVDTDRDNSSKIYGLQSIPKVFLFGRDGKLIGLFRGEQLMREVEKALRGE